MGSSARSWTVSSFAWLGLAACVNQSTVGPVGAAAAGVRVENGDPPAGARLVGPITVSDGDRCSLTGGRGTRAGATVLMQQAAKRQGMDWVKVVLVTMPYSGHDCFHGEYIVKGVGYSLEASAAPTGSAAAVCNPPCSPGYACNAGVCAAECNPACAAAQMCRADRVCVPAS